MQLSQGEEEEEINANVSSSTVYIYQVYTS